MPFFQDVPNTIPDLIAGYIVIGSVGLVYVTSLVMRQRNLRRDVETLDMLNEDE